MRTLTPFLLATLTAALLLIHATPQPASAQLSAPAPEVQALFRQMVATNMESFTAHLEKLAIAMSTKFNGFDIALAGAVRAAGKGATADATLASIRPGLTRAAAAKLPASEKGLLSVALLLRSREAVSQTEINELVYGLALRAKKTNLTPYERAVLAEVVQWRKEGIVVRNGHFYPAAKVAASELQSALKTRFATTKIDGSDLTLLDAISMRRPWSARLGNAVEDLQAQLATLPEEAERAVLALGIDQPSKLSTLANKIGLTSKTVRTADENLNLILQHLADPNAPPMNEFQASAVSRVIGVAYEDAVRAGDKFATSSQAALVDAAPRFFAKVERAALESRTFVEKALKGLPELSDTMSVRYGMGRPVLRKVRTVETPSGTALRANDLKAEIDNLIVRTGEATQTEMRAPALRTSRGDDDYLRQWTKSSATVKSKDYTDVFDRYSSGKFTTWTPRGDLALQMGKSNYKVNAYNYELATAALIRADMPIPIDELLTMADLIRTKTVKYRAILSPAEREFITAFGELLPNIGKTRVVWRDGMLLSESESRELIKYAEALRAHKFTTNDAMHRSLSSVQTQMHEEIAWKMDAHGGNMPIPDSLTVAEVLADPSPFKPTLIDVIKKDLKWLDDKDSAVKLARANSPVARMIHSVLN